ncbi:MAG: hypothetical protein A2Z88_11615 [Omnitrophica WOR_2 bacterium GWA2_47_8]|nr:MAG: hypothetical protein A2Z88_11615 [Omnitrophica WOR_2 bacterium GWA2_47_8]
MLLERLHFQDIIDYLFGARQGFSYSRKKGNSFLVHSRYHNSLSASFHIGYSGEEKKRILRASLKGQEILCDLQKGELRITKKGVSTTLNRSEGMLPLEKEIQTFVNILKGSKAEYVDGKKGANIIQEIEAIKPLKKQRRPSVAVIGGGIFGATCASLLGKSCSVTLFERKNDLMLESSFVNQYRHHKGYHYPRSPETVEECQRSAAAFMQEYGQAIQEEFPSYYCVAKKGSRTSPEGFLKFCRENLLPVVREFPSEGVLSRENVALSLKTSEGIYHYPTLKALIRSKLEKNANVSLKFLHQVVGAKILPDGKKELTVRGKNVHRQKFDYVINATYANINAFMSWLSFPEKDLRIDLMELLVIRLPIPKMSITMMDGPFATFVTTGDDGLFTLGHVRESVHSTVMPKNGKIPKFSRRSNGKNILQESIAWYPILKKAKVIDSRFVIRGINAYREHDDARPSDVISHGFGCWSILGGKVITCVSTARLIEKEINEGIMP